MRHPVNDLFATMGEESAWKKAFEAYLDDGGDVNHHNVFLSSPHLGKTLLIHAIELNSLAIVKKLLDGKANPNITHSKTGQSPLSYLISNSKIDADSTTICKLLLDHAADVNKVDDFTYMSPLYHILTTPIVYTQHHAMIVRNLLGKNAISAFKSHSNYFIGEKTSLDTPRTIVLHQNPAFLILSNDTQPLTHDYYAIVQFLIKKAREKTYIQLYNFFPGDKAARTLDKYSDCTLFQHLVMCNNRVYPFTPLTYLFTSHCAKLPSHQLIQYVLDNSDAQLHPDAKFLSSMEKSYKELLADGKVLTLSRPNVDIKSKDKSAATAAALQPIILPDPRLVYQTYCDLGFTVLNNILSHPSPYDDNTLNLIHSLFQSESFKLHYKRWVYYSDSFVSGYFDYKTVEHYKKTKTTTADGSYQLLLYDPAHEERYSLPNRIVLNDDGEAEYITDFDSDAELFVVELKSDPFFININHMCTSYYDISQQKTNVQLLQQHLHHGSFFQNSLFFPNGVGEHALVHGLTSNGIGIQRDDDDDNDNNHSKADPNGLVHRSFDEFFNNIYELLLSHTVSLHLTKEQLDVGRELMAAQIDNDDNDDGKKKSKKDKEKKQKDKSLLNHGDSKHSTEHHNYMYRASGSLLLSIRGRSQPNVDFIEYLIHIHHATTTISMYSFHNIFLWLLSSCQDLELDRYRYLLTLLLDEAGCDVLSVKYQQRMHQLTQKPGGPNGMNPNQLDHSTTNNPEHSVTEGSRLGSVTRNGSHSQHHGRSGQYYEPDSMKHSQNTSQHGQSNNSTLMNGATSNNGQMEESVSKKGSRSFFSRFTSIFNTGPSALITKTLARQYSFDYFSLVLLYCLVSPRTSTYLYIYTLMTTLHDRLVTHQSQLTMSLVVSRDGFKTFNRDHIHSTIIEFSPLFTSEQSVMNDRKHVANTLLLYFMVYGNLRLHAASDLYSFMIKQQPFKSSSYYLFMKCFLTLHNEQYFHEYKDDNHHHNKAYIQSFHDDVKKWKIQRYGSKALDSNLETMSTVKHYDGNEIEEERLMLDLKVNPCLLLTPRSPLLTDSGYQFFELLIQDYWLQEVKILRQQYHFEESALNDPTNTKNQIYNEQFTSAVTNFITNLVNTTIYSPQDGICLYKIVDKFLTIARNDILSHRQELDSKLTLWLQTDANNNINKQEQKVVNLDGDEHTTDLSLFTHANGSDYSYKIDCTKLFHTAIPVSTDMVRALTSLLAEQYHIILVYYQQYFNHIAISPYAYHICHSVLENPTVEELPTTPASIDVSQQGLGLHLQFQNRHKVIIIDDDESEPTTTTNTNGTTSTSTQTTSDKKGHTTTGDDTDLGTHSPITNVPVGGLYGRISLASNPNQKQVSYDPLSIQSVIEATYASTIDQISLAHQHLLILRNKKVESFMRYRGALPAIYGLLRATSQQALTPTWFQLFDLLIGECKDIFSIAKYTRTSPLSIYLFSCFVFDNNSLSVAKWLLQPPITISPQDETTKSSTTTQQRPKLTKVSDFLHTSLPPPPTQPISITSQEYSTKQQELTKLGQKQHFDYVEALYSLVTAPAHRHNQVYKSLLEKVLLFIHPDDLNLFSFDPNTVLTQQELQQQQLTYQMMFKQYNMNKSIVSQYLSHLSSPSQMSISILHLLIKAGGKVHLANPTTNQSPLIYFVQQQTHQQSITPEFFEIFKLLFQNYGHCGVLLLTHEHRTLFELALTHIKVMDDICVDYLLLLLSTSHIAYRHALGYPDVMEELALLERNKNKRLMAPVLAVDRADGLWSKTHKLIDSAWVEPTGHTLFGSYNKQDDSTTTLQQPSQQQLVSTTTPKRQFTPSKLTREEFSSLFDFYYSTMYLAPNARYFSVVHALANHRDQHIVATIFGNVPNHESYLYYSSSTRDVTLKQIIIQALAARKKELNNNLNFTVNLEIVDCIDNVEPIQVDEEIPIVKSGAKGATKQQTGALFRKQLLESATPNTAPAIPEWATALSDTMHLNFNRKRQQRTVRDGTEGLFWYIINNVQSPRLEDIVTLLDGCFDEAGQRLSTPVTLSYVNFNNETPLMHAILRRWDEDILIFMINKIGVDKVLKDRDNNGRTAYEYMSNACTHLYAPKAVELLQEARNKA